MFLQLVIHEIDCSIPGAGKDESFEKRSPTEAKRKCTSSPRLIPPFGKQIDSNIINPKTITGAPIDWLIGGNPLLEGVWFFGNGMVCFKTSYDFFMIALEDHEDVQKIVREVKGMLPQANSEA